MALQKGLCATDCAGRGGRPTTQASSDFLPEYVSQGEDSPNPWTGSLG